MSAAMAADELDAAIRAAVPDILNRLNIDFEDSMLLVGRVLGRRPAATAAQLVHVDAAGVRVIEARLSHLAYAPEIAGAMLQRQQAGAVIAARVKIVEGAVSMVEMALDQLKAKGVVELDEERRAAMVSNLLVVLCADRATQPVVNAGSIY